jgi:hypothetical protein
MVLVVDEELRRVSGMAHVVCSVMSLVASVCLLIHMKVLRKTVRLFRYVLYGHFAGACMIFSFGGVLIVFMVQLGTTESLACTVQGILYVAGKSVLISLSYFALAMINNVVNKKHKIHLPFKLFKYIRVAVWVFGFVIALGLSAVSYVGPASVWCTVKEDDTTVLIRWFVFNVPIIFLFIGILFVVYQIRMSEKAIEGYKEEDTHDSDDPFPDEIDEESEDENNGENATEEDEGERLNIEEVHRELYLMVVPVVVVFVCLFISVIFEMELNSSRPKVRSRTTKDREIFMNKSTMLMLLSTITPLVGFFLFLVSAMIGMLMSREKHTKYIQLKAGSDMTAEDLKDT